MREAGGGAREGLHSIECRIADQAAISVCETPQSDGQERECRADTARRAASLNGMSSVALSARGGRGFRSLRVVPTPGAREDGIHSCRLRL